jgi:iron complex transport system substrate-binding protein
MPRIVSLLPSATEIVCALGFGGDLVGRSHECDYPPWVTRLPVCTAPKFSTEGTSAQINERVGGIISQALSVYSVDSEKLKQLTPEVIVTQSQCEVCAVSEADVEKAVAEWLGARPQIVSLSPQKLADIFDDIERVAKALGAEERGAEAAHRLKARATGIAEEATLSNFRPTIGWIEWIDPLMAGANWIPELIAMAGGASVFGKPGEHSELISFDDLRAKNPDVIFVVPCGFDIERTLKELPSLEKLEGWDRLRAVRGERVYVADGSHYFNRPGPRIVESLEILAEVLHPELFRFGHEGAGWRRIGAPQTRAAA